MSTYLDTLFSQETAGSATSAIPVTASEEPEMAQPVIKRPKFDIGSFGTPVIQTPDFNAHLCGMCRAHEHIYVCPRCQMKTCSVSCCQLHRRQHNCNGKKPASTALDLTGMNDETITKDYHFLENLSRTVEGATRTRFRNDERKSRGPRRKLLAAVEARGARLKQCPPGLSLSAKNTSQVRRGDVLLWRVEWHFEDSTTLCVDTKLTDQVVIRTALERFAGGEWKGLQSGDLQLYQSVPVSQWRVLLKNHDEREDEYWELNLDASLCENFVDKTILEFPVLIVKVTNDDEARSRVVIPARRTRTQFLELGEPSETVDISRLCG
ncbi:MAG: uncharacterized protein KVP18_004228 [Porospora cf. gigantea A]|uniref:uncharacterized protein n=1 Tax=Porospora cf. gigantea A TaxID=2853593 RepID=UPI003559DAA0|nr:MAG: hypothetical protein KVP18_004228 [Porospora cf. gigantea A]